MYYIGLDVHKLSISFCIQQADGTMLREGKLKANRQVLTAWAEQLPQPWAGSMEATLVSHWIYHHLKPFAADLQMGNPSRMRAICCAKKKTDRIDAAMIADLLRCNLLPAVNVLPEPFVRMRQILRYRRLLVECEVRMKNKIYGLLTESGIEYDRARLHGKNYFRRLLKNNQEIPPSVMDLLEFSREQAETLHRMEQWLVQGLAGLPQLAERVTRLTRIPGVGLIVALTWALEIGPVERIGSTSKAISYCGLTSALRSSADAAKRGPISKQRNRHLQSVLVETAKLAPQWNPALAVVHEREKPRGHANRATLAVARKLVAYLLAADRGHQPAARQAATAISA